MRNEISWKWLSIKTLACIKSTNFGEIKPHLMTESLHIVHSFSLSLSLSLFLCISIKNIARELPLIDYIRAICPLIEQWWVNGCASNSQQFIRKENLKKKKKNKLERKSVAAKLKYGKCFCFAQSSNHMFAFDEIHCMKTTMGIAIN